MFLITSTQSFRIMYVLQHAHDGTLVALGGQVVGFGGGSPGGFLLLLFLSVYALFHLRSRSMFLFLRLIVRSFFRTSFYYLSGYLSSSSALPNFFYL